MATVCTTSAGSPAKDLDRANSLVTRRFNSLVLHLGAFAELRGRIDAAWIHMPPGDIGAHLRAAELARDHLSDAVEETLSAPAHDDGDRALLVLAYLFQVMISNDDDAEERLHAYQTTVQHRDALYAGGTGAAARLTRGLQSRFFGHLEALVRAEADARAALAQHRTDLERIARALIERRELDAEGLAALLEPVKPIGQVVKHREADAAQGASGDGRGGASPHPEACASC